MPASLDCVNTGLRDAAGRAWRPTAKQRAYLEYWLDPTKPKSISAICRDLHLNRRLVYDWLTGPFALWFDEQCKATTEHLWQPLLLRTAQLAMSGSVEHARLLAQIRGALRDDTSQRGGGGLTVVIGVPRAGDVVSIPEDSPRPLLPPVDLPDLEQ